MPDRLTGCGLPVALSVILNEAVRVPIAAGVNNIAMVQLPPAATEVLQVLASVKSVVLVPVKAMLETINVAVPELVRVTV